MDHDATGPTGVSIARTTDGLTISDRGDTEPVKTTQTGPLIDRRETTHTDHVDDTVLQISGAGHWLTAMSDSLYHRWEHWDVLQGHCAVQMELVLECLDVLTAWCHSWDC